MRHFAPIRMSLLVSIALLLVVNLSTQAQVEGKEGDPIATDRASVAYRVKIDTKGELFIVSAALENISPDTLVFSFPKWGPGAYDTVNFGAWVYDFTATAESGRKLTVVRGDTNTFRVIGCSSARHIDLNYKVKDIESTPISLWFGLTDIEPSYAFANAVGLFGYPQGFKEIPYTVEYVAPKGWKTAVGLDPIDVERNIYRAADYDELVDAPVQMGTFQRIDFEVNGIPHIITVTAPKPLSTAQLAAIRDTTDHIVRLISGFFGDMPYKRYVFQHYLANPTGGDFSFGALEHRNSSSYRMPYTLFQSPAEMLASVIAHEYWHTWSPKRIHVHQLGPFDYQNPVRTNSLWFAEGMTEYYAQVLLARSGMDSPGKMFATLNQVFRSTYGRVQNESMGSLSMRIAEAPMNEMIAVYSKGPVVVLLLDAAIRKQTANRKSLDDAVRYFNENYGKTGASFGDDDIFPIIEKATGTTLGDFYRRFIVGTEPLPYDEYLPILGLKIESKSKIDTVLGVEAEKMPRGAVITTIVAGGSADRTGIQVGDAVIGVRWRGQEITTKDFPLELLAARITRSMTDIQIERNGKEIWLPIQRVATTTIERVVVQDPAASPIARTIRLIIFGKDT